MLQLSKNDYKIIAEKVESGDYFKDARDWYSQKYMMYFIERSYLLLILLFFVFLMFLCYSYYSAILPIKKSLPVKVSISSTADYTARITYLGNEKKEFDINNLYIKYFISRFVEAIESYDYRNDFKKLKISKNIIETLATKDILAYYMDRISIRNPDSITLKFRKKISRTIKVDQSRIEFSEVVDNDEFNSNSDKKIKNYLATANFEATEYNKDTGEKVVSNWQAKISLSFENIEYNYEEKDFSPLNFKVTNYESKKIN